MHNFYYLLEEDVSPIINDSNVTTSTQTAEQQPAGDEQAAPADPLGNVLMIGFWVLMLGALYFFTIRPQRKRDKQMKEMQGGIKPGDHIVTNAGLYGKVLSVGEDCFVVEFGINKGVHIPVRKSEVLGVKEPVLTPAAKDSSKE